MSDYADKAAERIRDEDCRYDGFVPEDIMAAIIRSESPEPSRALVEAVKNLLAHVSTSSYGQAVVCWSEVEALRAALDQTKPKEKV